MEINQSGAELKIAPADINLIKEKPDNKPKVPYGATIISNKVLYTVVKIENGYLLTKNYDIEYQIEDRIKYLNYNKQWYSKTNPIAIKEPNLQEDRSDSFVDELD